MKGLVGLSKCEWITYSRLLHVEKVSPPGYKHVYCLTAHQPYLGYCVENRWNITKKHVTNELNWQVSLHSKNLKYWNDTTKQLFTISTENMQTVTAWVKMIGTWVKKTHLDSDIKSSFLEFAIECEETFEYNSDGWVIDLGKLYAYTTFAKNIQWSKICSTVNST